MPKILKPDKAISALENFSIFPYQSSVKPRLCVLMEADAGEDDMMYLKSIGKCADKYGAEVKVNEVADLMDAISAMTRIRKEKMCSGILMLGAFDATENAVLKGMIPPRVDIDCVNSTTYGKFATTTDPIGYRSAPCTAVACYKVLEYEDDPLKGASVGIIGRSLTVGRPLAEILISKGSTVTVYNSHSDLSTLKYHDVVVSATGKANLVTGNMLSAGQWVIDVGMNRDDDGKLCGDVDFKSACEAVGEDGAITPVPGGVGPLTNAVLFSKLFYNAYIEQNGGTL